MTAGITSEEGSWVGIQQGSCLDSQIENTTSSTANDWRGIEGGRKT